MNQQEFRESKTECSLKVRPMKSFQCCQIWLGRRRHRYHRRYQFQTNEKCSPFRYPSLQIPTPIPMLFLGQRMYRTGRQGFPRHLYSSTLYQHSPFRLLRCCHHRHHLLLLEQLQAQIKPIKLSKIRKPFHYTYHSYRNA